MGMGITNIAQHFANGQFLMGALCTDCYLSLYGTGDWSHVNDTALDQLSRYEILPGHLHGNAFDDRCYHTENGCDWSAGDDYCDCQEPSFSSHGRPCLVCQDRLDGDRYDVVAVDRA